MLIKLRFYQLLINWDAKSGLVGCWKLKKKKRELLELEQDDESTLFLFLLFQWTKEPNRGLKLENEVICMNSNFSGMKIGMCSLDEGTGKIDK